MPITTRMIPQAKLSMECWTIQMQGLNACKGCEFNGKRDCGGKKIRKSGKNLLGYTVPIGE
jgi:hypothetical protein